MNSIKKILLTLSLLTLTYSANSQTYGNEWINYNQDYYDFKIVQDGIYQLDYSTLVNAGIPVNSFQSENIQIFGREKEIPLIIYDGGDSSMDPGDYILFYAERNDGWLDETIYDGTTKPANPDYSLYNDTISYFFTWNSSTSNLRFNVESDVNYAAYSSIENYILFESKYSANNEYHEGEKLSTTSSSFYKPGEGWGSPKVNGASGTGYSTNIGLNTPFPYTDAGSPNARFLAHSLSASNASYSGSGNHHLKWEIGNSYYEALDTIYTGYRQIICDKSFSSTIISNGSTNIRWSIIHDQGAATDYQAYNYMLLEYPRQVNFGGLNALNFKINNNAQGKVRLDVTNVNYNDPIMLVLGTNPKLIPFEANGAYYSALIPNSTDGSIQEVIYKDRALVINVSSLEPVTTTAKFTDYSSLNMENALLFVYHSSLKNATDEYKTYRESNAGGNYNVIAADVDELYHQFGGGIEKHINGIRRFAHYIYNSSTSKPVGLYLIGKGIREADYNAITSDGPGTRKSPSRFQQSLIPSFGHPSSDVCITNNLEGPKKWAPLMATGRISVRSNLELLSYLQKVKELEIEQDPNSTYNSFNKDWQKHILHFAGGNTINEQVQFQNYMNNYENIISDSLYGGFVHRVYKSNSDPLDPTVLSAVTERIQNGISLMTYFGHASATNSGFEINLDEPSNWGNSKKYPMMLVNSCYNGNIFQLNSSKSEEFVQAPNYGAIGYIANVSVGFDTYLNIYSQSLYRHISYKNYNQNIGTQMKANIETLETSINNLYLETSCTQMVLNGDPMVNINSHQKPEIELTQQGVYFTPNDLNLAVDSIEMHIVLTNLGQSVTDTVLLEVRRSFPSSSIDSIYTFQIPKLDYKDTFSFKMPLQPNISIGANTFSVKIDIPSYVDEQYDEVLNNQLTKILYVDIDGIVPVVPYEFAVVPNDSTTLRASTINPIADFNTYRFEIDTVDFEGTVPQSIEYRYALVSGLGGVKSVNPSEWLSVSSGISDPLILEDSVVYFWRVSIAGDTTWRESSFQYIQNKTGWGQDHFYQFKKNGFYNVGYDRINRKRSFVPSVSELTCNVFSTSSSPGFYYNAFYIDGNLQDYGIGYNLTYKILVAVLDPVTLKPWGTKFIESAPPFTVHNPTHNFGNSNNESGRIWKYFTFEQNDATQLANFQNMIDQVPDGHYVLIYTPIAARYDLWNSLDSVNMYTTFADLGSDSINGSRPNRPFAFLVQKGDTNSVLEMLAEVDGGDVHMITDIVGADNYGQESSTLIGPAARWGNVYWKQDASEIITTDTTRLIINGYDLYGVLQTTIDTLFTSNDSILNLTTFIDANQYPYIDLNAIYSDTVDLTPAQIDRWHVLFDPLPEAAIDGSNQYTWTQPSDTLEEGQTVDFAVDIRNIYSIDMDSILISYWIEDAQQNRHDIPYARQDSLRVNQTIRDTVTFSTVGLSGINSLWVEVNPYINGSNYITDQPEQLHFNNLLQIPFFVNPDDKNPILDVTFNGNHILNGDIIDPNSEILITLKDDNEFLIMDNVADTALFGVYLTDPFGNQKRIPFVNGQGETIMQWIPADASNKRFKIVWPEEFEADGKYTLFVQGADRSGNVSGEIEYRVTFEIIRESTITNMMNYPNPFSTSTRFVFTLTGTEAPEDIIIQIMTVTGKVVREITEDQIGPIYIGRNVTEYAWDGTDEFGDRLANGVYLYRVKAQINGEAIKHRESGADVHFEKSFGKMYLMR